MGANDLVRPAIVVMVATMLSPAVAQEIPYRGHVTSVEQNSSLSFTCSGGSEAIRCEFIQTLVSQETPSSPDQTEEMMRQALEEGASSNLCGQTLDQLRTVEAGGDFGVELDDRQRNDAIAYLSLLQSFCDSPNEATAMALFDSFEDRKARSCKIGTLPFDLTMHWNDQSGRWESVSAPEGACGIVTMSFLEKDGETPLFWNYREQTVVTNKTGNDTIRGDCSAWPEETLTYNWQMNTLHRSCEYVSFGF